MGIMVLAYHAVFTTYGFWLPNDPRGSWSDFVRSMELFRHGRSTKTRLPRSLARDEHDYVARLRAKGDLKFSPVVFSGVQARAVARGFAVAVDRSGYSIHAGAILSEHVHVIVSRHPAHPIERIVAHLKGEATKRLFAEEIHPLIKHHDWRGKVPTPWGQKRGWVVYLNDVDAILRSIRYVEENPVREGKRCQNWRFFTPFTS